MGHNAQAGGKEIALAPHFAQLCGIALTRIKADQGLIWYLSFWVLARSPTPDDAASLPVTVGWDAR
jgi:hypothetical protein